ncbi:hypothetical protein CROQUDRAFT_104977 [Cronartium quercuum f. sp. fusiforme G11]|uniref:SUN domain-containing protein n=1 Tax=Cronartium quercuum f. sp. fusiforme G11 TaxID=708437 RepID=A0A9P6NPF2_9BASI|nr:hypothetical protein CROQUDRAFT_104977 [Cronartium quercuum f. sp. fusiforme G11]
MYSTAQLMRSNLIIFNLFQFIRLSQPQLQIPPQPISLNSLTIWSRFESNSIDQINTCPANPLPTKISTPSTSTSTSTPSASLPPSKTIIKSTNTKNEPSIDNPTIPKLLSFSEWKAKGGHQSRKHYKRNETPSQQPSSVPIQTDNHSIFKSSSTPSPIISSQQQVTDSILYPELDFALPTQALRNYSQNSYPTEPYDQRDPLSQPSIPDLNLSNASSASSSSSSFPPSQQTSELLNLSETIYHPDPNTGTNTKHDPLIKLSSRTNYASFDCSASIHRSSKLTKSASSILNEKKDKYMLTPCRNKNKNFIIFELCDEIEIDHIILANFEFFSSMFKSFKVFVSNSGLEEGNGGKGIDWVYVGLFRTRNVRGIQVFPIKHLKGFYRYVRLDFLSHYGSEYYCPLSLVRIYGLTQIDAYRRDEEIERRRAMEMELEEDIIHDDETDDEEQIRVGDQTIFNLSTQNQSLPNESLEDVSNSEEFSVQRSSVETESDSINPFPAPTGTPILSDSSTPKNEEGTETFPEPLPVTEETERAPVSESSEGVQHMSESVASPGLRSTTKEENITEDIMAEKLSESNTNNEEPMIVRQPSRSVDEESIRKTSSRQIPPLPPSNEKNSVITATQATESIFGQIMKRLNALESNLDLTLRYVEDQVQLVERWILRLDKLIISHSASFLSLLGILIFLSITKFHTNISSFNDSNKERSNETKLRKRLVKKGIRSPLRSSSPQRTKNIRQVESPKRVVKLLGLPRKPRSLELSPIKNNNHTIRRPIKNSNYQNNHIEVIRNEMINRNFHGRERFESGSQIDWSTETSSCSNTEDEEKIKIDKIEIEPKIKNDLTNQSQPLTPQQKNHPSLNQDPPSYHTIRSDSNLGLS